MTKNILLLFFISLFVSNAFAQKNLDKSASKITQKMTTALSLDEEQKLKVYEIQLNRFQEVANIRKEYNNDTKTRKIQLRKVYNRLHGKLTKVLGKEKMQEWANFKQNN